MPNVPQVRTWLLLEGLCSDSHLLCRLRVPSLTIFFSAVREELAPRIFSVLCLLRVPSLRNIWSLDRVILLTYSVRAILSISTVTGLMDAPALISSGAVWPIAARLSRVEERTSGVLIFACVSVLTLWLVYIRCEREWMPQWTYPVLARDPIITLLFLARCHLGVLRTNSSLCIPVFYR